MRKSISSVLFVAISTFIISTVLLLLSTTQKQPFVQAWSAVGHQLIATIAKNHLSERVAAVTDSYFKYFSEMGPFPRVNDMISGACLADDMKEYGLTQMDQWHYTDIVYDINNTYVHGCPLQKDNSAEFLGKFVQAAKYQQHRPWVVSFATAYIVHLYADIHQPLHNIDLFSKDEPNGDAGGNNEKITYFSGTNATTTQVGYPVVTSLHHYWDIVCGQYPHDPLRPLNKSYSAFLDSEAERIMKSNPVSKKEGDVYKGWDMAYESYNLAKNFSYANISDNGSLIKDQGGWILADYHVQCLKVAEKQIALAGVRLAKQLEYAFKYAKWPTTTTTAAPQTSATCPTTNGNITNPSEETTSTATSTTSVPQSTTASPPPPSNSPRKVQVVTLLHRHGARHPDITDTALAKKVCGSADACGQLTRQGKAMLFALGTYLRQRYVAQTITKTSTTNQPLEQPSAAFYESFGLNEENYNFNRLYSRSTDIDRTLQSSDSMLRGLFPNFTSYFPIVHTIPKEEDQMMIPSVNVNFAFSQQTNQWPSFFNWTLPKIVSASLCKTIAAEVHLQSLCDSLTESSSNADYLECTLKLSDIASSFYSMGILNHPEYKELKANKEKLDLIMKWTMNKNYGFYPEKYSDQKQAGSVSYDLATKMFENFDTELYNLFEKPSKKVENLFYEFSGHDITVAPLLALFGHNELTHPSFAQTVGIELIVDEQQNNETYVRIFYGNPKTMSSISSSLPLQEMASHYDFEFNYISVPCLSSKGEFRNVTDGSCSYSDFKRYVNNVGKPASPAGTCYLNDFLVNMVGCQKSSAPMGVNTPCHTYRKMCPTSPLACPTGESVNLKDMSCSKDYTPSSSSTTAASSTTTQFTCPTTATTNEASSSTTTISPSSHNNNHENGNNASNAASGTYTKNQLIEYVAGAGGAALIVGIIVGALIMSCFRPAGGSGTHGINYGAAAHGLGMEYEESLHSGIGQDNEA